MESIEVGWPEIIDIFETTRTEVVNWIDDLSSG